mmetsp:Transcript_40547/g.72935  ORF Transcript_40547/g.72935 Transcript_40547/m.72935 type:complete len:92 (+) Transcript_40547:24-299(+)
MIKYQRNDVMKSNAERDAKNSLYRTPVSCSQAANTLCECGQKMPKSPVLPRLTLCRLKPDSWEFNTKLVKFKSSDWSQIIAPGFHGGSLQP